MERAEQECAADADVRIARRAQAALREQELDQKFILQFAGRVRELYPSCPAGRERTIAGHACRKYSGRVGRSAAAKTLDEAAVRLAVAAHVRHTETAYDDLLRRGGVRHAARRQVHGRVSEVLGQWESIR